MQRRRYNPARTILLGFLLVIITGALLLSLPVSARGAAVPVPAALFTAVSAACVTGLTAVDTAAAFSPFGQAVILCLAQIGGLGVMSVTTIFFFIMRRKINLSQRLLIMQSMNLRDIQGIIRLVRHVFIGTLAFEGAGALVLWTRFAPEYGLLDGLGMGVFHAVSAFCNAGFSLLGAGSGMGAYSGDPAVMLTLMLLVTAGGIGFFVWEDIWRCRRFRALHVHSKLVICISLCLLLAGWAFFFLAEADNPATLGGMALPDALLLSLSQSVMTRSGGFAALDQGALSGASRMLTMLLMFVGGSAGSTAGGVKNVTTGIVLLSAVKSLRGRSRLDCFGRTIPARQVLGALSIIVMAASACITGAAAIALLQPDLPMGGIAFEMVSAVATCGLSAGITARLGPASLCVVAVFMFLGRIGIMTVGMAAFLNRNSSEKMKHPDAWVMM